MREIRNEWMVTIALLVTIVVLAVVVGIFSPPSTIIHIVRTPSPHPAYFKIPEPYP